MELLVVRERIVRKMGNAAAGMSHWHRGGGVVVVVVRSARQFYTPGCMLHVLLVQQCQWLQE